MLVRFLHLVAVGVLPLAWCSSAISQDDRLGGTSVGTSASVNESQSQSWLVRDPSSGRVFQQTAVSVNVPMTVWEVRPMTTTVYEATNVVKSVPTQNTIYAPSTQYVMQPRLRGWWNPLRQPVQSYEFVPVTTWHPQTQTVNSQVATVQWVPKQQVVYVQQPIQRMQTQQQIVSKEIPQPALSLGLSQPLLAAQPRALINIPLLGQQVTMPSPPIAPNSLGNVVNNGLRPIASAISPSYNPPLRTASSAGSSARDAFQSGMAATELR